LAVRYVEPPSSLSLSLQCPLTPLWCYVERRCLNRINEEWMQQLPVPARELALRCVSLCIHSCTDGTEFFQEVCHVSASVHECMCMLCACMCLYMMAPFSKVNRLPVVQFELLLLACEVQLDYILCQSICGTTSTSVTAPATTAGAAAGGGGGVSAAGAATVSIGGKQIDKELFTALNVLVQELVSRRETAGSARYVFDLYMSVTCFIFATTDLICAYSYLI